MNFSRFTNPANEPRTVEEIQERRDEMSERWHDQKVDRENEQPAAKFIALYAGLPIKLHTNLCGKWFAMADEVHATKFVSEQTAVSQCALHGVPSVTIVQVNTI